MPRYLRLLCLWFACLASFAAAPVASAETSNLSVGVTIQKRAKLQVLSHPGTVRVTAADIARGYVEVSAPLEVSVESNSPAGYMLVFAGQADFVRQARLQGLDGEIQLDAAGGLVPQRAAGRGRVRQNLELRFRFILADNAVQGNHAWPMHVSVAPL